MRRLGLRADGLATVTRGAASRGGPWLAGWADGAGCESDLVGGLCVFVCVCVCVCSWLVGTLCGLRAFGATDGASGMTGKLNRPFSMYILQYIHTQKQTHT